MVLCDPQIHASTESMMHIGQSTPTPAPSPPLEQSERHEASSCPTYLVIHGPPSTWLHLNIWLGPE